MAGLIPAIHAKPLRQILVQIPPFGIHIVEEPNPHAPT
jgi:hypothetical protein